MSFLNIWFLYFMLPPFFIFAYFILSGKISYEKYFNPAVLEKILIKGDILGKSGRNILFLFAIFCFIFALARPISEPKNIKISQESKNLVIALDISSSMKADDIYPNRLEFTKNRLLKLINELNHTNIGIVAFARDAFLVSPLTSDKSSLEFLLNNLNSDTISRQGTSISNALTQISKMFTKGGVRDVFLISDGGEDNDIQKAIKIAKENRLKVSIMVVGTKKGGIIKTQNGLLKDKNGNIVITKRNDELIALSRASGGVYIKEFGAGNGVELLKNSLQKTKAKSKDIKTQKEWFLAPLILGFLTLLVAFHGLPKRALKTKPLLAAMILAFLMPAPSFGGVFDFFHLKNANEYLQKKEYEKAINEYNKLTPNNQINYNKGNAYYKQNKFKEAIKEYEKVKSEDKVLKTQALFNEANAYNKLGEHEKALELYKKAEKLNPNDEDIKKNKKITKKLIKKKKKQQKKNDKNKNEQQNKQNSENKNEQNKQNQKNQKSKNKDNKNQKNEPKNDDQNKTQKQSNEQNQTIKPIQAKQQKDLEGEKWEAYLKKVAPKTNPIMIGENEGDTDENNW